MAANPAHRWVCNVLSCAVGNAHNAFAAGYIGPFSNTRHDDKMV